MMRVPFLCSREWLTVRSEVGKDASHEGGGEVHVSFSDCVLVRRVVEKGVEFSRVSIT